MIFVLFSAIKNRNRQFS